MAIWLSEKRQHGNHVRLHDSPNTLPRQNEKANAAPSTTALNKTGYPNMHYRTSSLNKSGSPSSVSTKFALSPDPSTWGNSLNQPEDDDDLHKPDRDDSSGSGLWSTRGIANIGCLAILVVGIVSLFAVYPMVSYFTTPRNFVEPPPPPPPHAPLVNMVGRFDLVDPDTPEEARTKASLETGEEMVLVFSDEFNTDGRTFWPGDDPFWVAEDYHYWGTNNSEWYSPQAISTVGGYLNITLKKERNHDLNYEGGLMTTWNRFCFRGGYIEASVSLPGNSHTNGLWPAIWTLGNLGRAGYGASLDGLWPYTYDTCDIGTLRNQSRDGVNPDVAFSGGPQEAPYFGTLSFLPGQRLSACTCSTADPAEHPGPRRGDGWRGRGAPEIDMFEAQVPDRTLVGEVSQSCQFAPFNADYTWDYNATSVDALGNVVQALRLHSPTSQVNGFKGNPYQEAGSGVTETNQECYVQDSGCFSVYGFEYRPGVEGAYITWVNDGQPAWTIRSEGVGPDANTQIGQRLIPDEPMYIIANLGLSTNFGPISDKLVFPTWMLVDYIRVYQPANAINIGCEPEGYPTQDYINAHIEAYTNPNLTTWKDYLLNYTSQEVPAGSFGFVANNMTDPC